MDPLVFWNKLQEMNYDEIIHWIEVEEIKGVPGSHNRCLLSELGKKTTGRNWGFSSFASFGLGSHEKTVFLKFVTASMAEVMSKFDKGFLEQFVKEEGLINV